MHSKSECTDFHQALGADAQYVAILARHFPDRLKNVSAEDFEAILGPVSEGDFNTLSAAYAVLALKSYSHSIVGRLAGNRHRGGDGENGRRRSSTRTQA